MERTCSNCKWDWYCIKYRIKMRDGCENFMIKKRYRRRRDRYDTRNKTQ